MQGQISRSPSSTKLWRTEQTYRGWGRRFAAWLAPRAMESATDDDVRAFLSHLVLDGDVAAATQRQALNALVFFLRTHLDAIRSLFDEDRACGMAGVWLPPPIEHKRPSSGIEWAWQWVFPSRQTAVDPRSGLVRRHHVQDAAFQAAVRAGAQRADIPKRVTPHVLRIPSPPICWPGARTSVPCRSFSGMPTSRPP